MSKELLCQKIAFWDNNVQRFLLVIKYNEGVSLHFERVIGC